MQTKSSPDSVNMACVASSELMPKLPRCALQLNLSVSQVSDLNPSGSKIHTGTFIVTKST